MAIFDPALQRMCIRIVYDGAAAAGKTTNLKALCTLFATQRATEIFSPGEIDGRTLYFDWVQIMAGAVCGFPLMCQIISVPGQTVLTPRRRHLLETADVVVLVCDSSPPGIERAKQGLALLQSTTSVGLLVQANKQDQPNARSGADVLEGLGLPADSVIIEAIATEGIGVIDTFVNAVRLVSKKVQHDVEAESLRIAVGPAPGAAELLERLTHEAIDPEWAAEMLLEEANAALLIEGSKRSTTSSATSVVIIEEERSAPTTSSNELLSLPLLPQPDVEVGFVWPAHTGRTLLDRLADELRDKAVRKPTYETMGGYVLSTAPSLRFEDREAARQALVRAARERTQLDPRITMETVLVAQPARDQSWWLWSIAPPAKRLLDVLKTEPEAGAQSSLVEAYAKAAAQLLRTHLERQGEGEEVDLSPASFGVLDDGTVRYIPRKAPLQPTTTAKKRTSAAEHMASVVEMFAREGLPPHLVETVHSHFTA